MYKTYVSLIFCIFTAITSQSAIANPSGQNLNWWIKHIAQQIETHPEVIAARLAMSGELYLADGLEKAIYNPELNSEYENEGSDKNYLIGINQSLDRSDKRGSRSRQAVFARIEAKENYKLIVQEKIAQALTVLIDYQTIDEKVQLVLEQESQLESLLDIVKQRADSGDLGQLDAELAYLTLSQKFAQAASIQAQKRRIEAQLTEIIPNWQSQTTDLPENIFQEYEKAKVELVVDDHPSVTAAKAQWEVMEMMAELAQKNKKPDPTIGINVGKTAGDNLVSLNFSMPLNFRNNFSSESQAAQQQALSAESNYLNLKRYQYYKIVGSQDVVHEYSNRYRKWNLLMQGRDKNSEKLLQNQWRIGDISTTEYLLTLQQRTEGLLSGIELEQEYKTAVIQLLLDTAQLKQTKASTTEKSQ